MDFCQSLGLKMLFEYCKIIENISQDEISILEDKYEVKK